MFHWWTVQLVSFPFSAYSAVLTKYAYIEIFTRVVPLHAICLHSEFWPLPTQKWKATASVKMLYDKMSNFSTSQEKVKYREQ